MTVDIPANTITAPAGFDPLNPGALFSELPLDGIDSPEVSQSVTRIVAPYLLREERIGRSRHRMLIIEYPYPAALPSENLEVLCRHQASVEVSNVVESPVVPLNLAAPEPTILADLLVEPLALPVALKAFSPSIAAGVTLAIPAVQVSAVALEPQHVGEPRTLVSVPAVSAGIEALAPLVLSDVSLDVPVANVSLAALAPRFPGLSVLTGTAAPMLGSGGAVAYDGWTLILDNNITASFLESGSFGFNFKLGGLAFNSCFIGTNGYLTFGQGFTQYSGFSATSPYVPKLLFAVGRNSIQRIYTKSGTAAGVSYFKIRYEATAGLTGIPGSPDLVYEFSFYGLNSANSQLVEVRIGNDARLSSNYYIASASVIYAKSRSAPNTSWVFEGNSTGTSWTLTSNRFVEAS